MVKPIRILTDPVVTFTGGRTYLCTCGLFASSDDDAVLEHTRATGHQMILTALVRVTAEDAAGTPEG